MKIYPDNRIHYRLKAQKSGSKDAPCRIPKCCAYALCALSASAVTAAAVAIFKDK